MVGTPDNWKTAFINQGIWGVKDTTRHRALWERISPDDNLLFYATNPIGGVIGFGTVRTKFKQNKPLWPEEIEAGRVVWPYRFEFDTNSLFSEDQWEDRKIVNDKIRLLVRGGFQQIEQSIAEDALKMMGASGDVQFGPSSPPKPAKPESTHEEIRRKLIEIGRIQKFVAEGEYQMDGKRLDVVWRRIDKGVPTYVFEVQVGGDLYHALGKLKHAHDLWNSNIFLVAAKKDVAEAMNLLSGTYHEIKEDVKVIELLKIDELLRLKKQYKEFEMKLGIA